jgi:ATP-dependent Clp protease protease subunit
VFFFFKKYYINLFLELYTLKYVCTVHNFDYIKKTRVMIHQPASSYYDGQAGECMMEAEEVLKLRDYITRVYVQRIGKPLWLISEDMERDVFMSAKEAKTYGIVDAVAIENT